MTIELPPPESVGGRDVRLRIGVDMGGSDIKFGATNLAADQILTPNLVKRPSLSAEGPGKTVAQIIDGIGAVLAGLGTKWPDVADVSVTVPCTCTPDGVIIESTNLGTPETKHLWKVPFRDLLAEAVKEASGIEIPVFACNDANAAGQDDDFIRFGSDTRRRTGFFITTGTGLGGCVVVDGRVFFGVGQAGELGHLKPAVPAQYRERFAADDNPPCGCGGHHCVEARASLTALTRRIVWALGPEGAAAIEKELTARGEKINPDVLEKLREHLKRGPKMAAYNVRSFADRDGDAFCRWLLEDWAIMIGALFADVSPILHPNLMVIGGGMTEMSDAGRDWFIGIVRRVYGEINSQTSFDLRPGNCEIVWSVSRDQGWRGAILMSMRANNK